MLKDIPELHVNDIAVAVVQDTNENGVLEWNVYLLNFKKETIEGVLVTSKGYGLNEGADVKTSVLRHFLDTIPSTSYAKVEPIHENLFGLSNEYWVSFFLHGKMYDKKYVFLPETVSESFYITVPLLNRKGVMIR